MLVGKDQGKMELHAGNGRRVKNTGIGGRLAEDELNNGVLLYVEGQEWVVGAVGVCPG